MAEKARTRNTRALKHLAADLAEGMNCRESRPMRFDRMVCSNHKTPEKVLISAIPHRSACILQVLRARRPCWSQTPPPAKRSNQGSRMSPYPTISLPKAAKEAQGSV